MTAITLRGRDYPTGAYVLHIRCDVPRSITFGHYAGGRPVAIPIGDLVYVGSAMGRHATALAGRLLRHATRTEPLAPHPLRNELQAVLTQTGIDSTAPKTKRLHWHIDYLLDDPGVELVHVWMVRSAEPLEVTLADWLATQRDLQPVARGLGASDHRGATHLFHLGPGTTWSALAQHLDHWFARALPR